MIIIHHTHTQILILSPQNVYPPFTEGFADKDGDREEEQSEGQAVGKSTPVVLSQVPKARASVTKGDLIWRMDQNQNMVPA